MASALFAFLAGILTIAAPCTLPVLPILLGASLGQHSKARPVFIALGFVASFAAVTLAFTFVTELAGISPDAMRNAAIFLLAIFGVLMLWPDLYHRLAGLIPGRLSRHDGPVNEHRGLAGGFILGTTLGLVWTPCAGPVLASIVTLLATQTEIARAAALLFFYALGAAIPMLAIAYGGQHAATRVRALAPYTASLQRAFGVVVIGFAGTMYFQYDTLVTAWLTSFYPSGRIGL